MRLPTILALPALAALTALHTGCAGHATITSPSTIVLGIAQDGGVPQAGSFGDPRWDEPSRQRKVVCLGIVDPRSGKRWMIDATPDFRRQLLDLHRAAPARPAPAPVLDGIFLTHAHIGHYTGLMFLGKESIGAKSIPVWVMPRMAKFLTDNGPWSQLVKLANIELQPLVSGQPVEIADQLSVTPVLVPHRQEFSETVCFRIEGRDRAVLWLPDIDSWRELDDLGPRIEGLIASVDVAYLDGTFLANGEIPGRDMTGFPHPFVRDSLKRFASLPEDQRRKIRFIHLNHTNPALAAGSAARREIEAAGMGVASEGEVVPITLAPASR